MSTLSSKCYLVVTIPGKFYLFYEIEFLLLNKNSTLSNDYILILPVSILSIKIDNCYL